MSDLHTCPITPEHLKCLVRSKLNAGETNMHVQLAEFRVVPVRGMLDETTRAEFGDAAPEAALKPNQ